MHVNLADIYFHQDITQSKYIYIMKFRFHEREARSLLPAHQWYHSEFTVSLNYVFVLFFILFCVIMLCLDMRVTLFQQISRSDIHMVIYIEP